MLNAIRAICIQESGSTISLEEVRIGFVTYVNHASYLMIVWRTLSIKHIATQPVGIRMVVTIVSDRFFKRYERLLLRTTLVAPVLLICLPAFWTSIGSVVSAILERVPVTRHLNDRTNHYVKTGQWGLNGWKLFWGKIPESFYDKSEVYMNER